jgi:hypothetical protein
MEGVGGAASALARAGLALAAFGLAVSGVVVGTEGSTFPGAVPSVALAPTALPTPAVSACPPRSRCASAAR